MLAQSTSTHGAIAPRVLAAALVAVPFLSLAQTAAAQRDTSAAPTPAERVYTSVTIFDDEFTPLPGIDIQLEASGHPAILATTGQQGTSEFYHLKNGSFIECDLQETPIDGGLAVGLSSSFFADARGEGHLSFSRSLTQPKAHSMLIDDNGAEESRFFPEGRAYPFWDVNVPAKSGVNFSADIGMLMNDSVVSETLSYYGYPDDTTAWDQGLFMHVNTPGGANLGEMGVGLVMHNYGEKNYGTMQLDVIHFPPAGVGVDSFADTTPSVLSDLHIEYKPVDTVDNLALYYVGGELPEGYIFFVWREGKESNSTVAVSYELNTPVFNGSKDFAIDVVDLSNGEPEFSAACADCTPPDPSNDPSWTCTPGAVSGWTSFWNFGCPNDGDKAGDAVCEQWFYNGSKTPIFCSSNGTLVLTVTDSIQLSLSLPLSGGGTVGSQVTFSSSTSSSTDVVPGPNGCGECVRMNAVGLICAQEWKNWDDVICNVGGYCQGHTWTKPCHKYDPIYTHCVDSKISVTRCSRG